MGLEHSWRLDALCAQVGGDFWFAEKGPNSTADVNIAKAVCRLCEVRADCLDYALRSGQPHGIWGGLAPGERDRLRRRRGIRVQRWEPSWHGTVAGAKRHWREGTKVCPECSAAVRRARQK